MDDLAGTYFVQDRSNQEELKRLIVQERMATDAMGGVLPEQEDPNRFHRVLDIACGPGGWIIEVAQTYPQIKKLYGIDISPTMIQYAQKRAEEQQITQDMQQPDFVARVAWYTFCATNPPLTQVGRVRREIPS